jgi:uncharacterized phosphosugar-binding protein
MWETFAEEVVRQVKYVAKKQGEAIEKAAALVAGSIESDGIVHTFGSGHSALVAQEIFCRAGGIVPVNAILDPSFLVSYGALRSTSMERLPGAASVSLAGHQIRGGDVAFIISNSGKNQAPIEMAVRMKEIGVGVIAVTSMKHTMSVKTSHPSGKRLFEIADVILDSHVPVGDASVASTILGSFLVHSVIIEAAHILAEKGRPPAVFVSVNVDKANLDELAREFIKYRGRIRHF